MLSSGPSIKPWDALPCQSESIWMSYLEQTPTRHSVIAPWLWIGGHGMCGQYSAIFLCLSVPQLITVRTKGVSKVSAAYDGGVLALFSLSQHHSSCKRKQMCHIRNVVDYANKIILFFLRMQLGKGIATSSPFLCLVWRSCCEIVTGLRKKIMWKKGRHIHVLHENNYKPSF